MRATFGQIIKQARTRQNWDQARLAELLSDVGQQTVSRWERGLSRPRRAVVTQLAELLELNVRDLLAAAGYAATADKAGDVRPPVRPRSTTLPLEELTPEAFEQFSADLAHALYPDADVHRYGGQGHTQHGIDVVVRRAMGKPIAIQCKRASEFGPAKVAKAVAELALDVEECYIYLARVASPQAREEISAHNGWKLWDIEDLSRAVRSLPDRDVALRIVDTYFPGWREHFLGVRAPGPWLTSDEFFRPVSGDRIYTHDWHLVGRGTELRELQTFATSPGSPIAMIIGRGGIGKTRLLRALSRAVEQDESAKLRFLATGAAVEPAQFELLPPDVGLIVVIDDAHEQDSAALIGGVLRARPSAKILLSLRPQGFGRLAADLRHVGVHPSELPSWHLDDLARIDAEALAEEILGRGANRAVIQRLAGIAPDCPLLVVVGATLIKRGQLDPGRLESSESIRAEILTRFRDVVVADPTAGDAELRREVLKGVAALQPFRVDKPEFQEAMFNLTGAALDQVMPHLQGLEGAGVLLRRGTSFRVVPDLLGDVILADAAVHGPSGVSLGYLERVFQGASGEALQHALVNASRVDWQIRQADSAETLIKPMWAQLVAEFQAAGVYGRLALLKLLEKVAFFQPDRTLALVRWAIANPTDTVEEIDHPLSALVRTDYSVVLDEVPAVLEDVGYNLDHLPAVVDVLWELARHDLRPTNQHPNHPIRVLSELAAYGVGKPVIFHEVLADAAQRWLERGDVGDWPHSPFEVVKPLLETEFESRRFDGLSLTLSGHAVRVEAVAGVRRRVVDMAFTEAGAEDPKRAIDAVRILEASITYPYGLFGREISAAERDRWTPLFVETIDRLGQLAADQDLDPAVSVAVGEALRRHAGSTTATGPAAQAALARTAGSLDRRLAQVLHDGWGHAISYSGDVEDFERRRQAHFDEVAAAVTSQWSDEELVDHLAERLTTNRLAYRAGTSQPGPFVWTLVNNNPAIGDIICRRVGDDPTSVLRELIPIVLARLTDARPATAVGRAQELLATSDIVVQRAVAHAFGWGRSSRDGLVEGEAELLRSLIRHDDPVVRRLTVAAARTLGRSRHALGLELVSTVRFHDDADVAEEVAGIFSAGLLAWTDVSPTQADDFFGQLRACPRIDGYQTISMLGAISRIQPDAVLGLLKGRLEEYEQNRSLVDYQPSPHMWHNGLHFRESERFIESLRSIINWMAEGPSSSGYRRREGAEIFAAVADRFDEQVLTILTEAIESGEAQRIRAVGHILRNAPRTLVWEEVPFVTTTLRAAEKHGQDAVKAIGEGFHAATTTGGRWGTPGEPFPEDIEQRDRSIAVAARLPRGSIEQRFYQSLVASAESRIRWEEEHDRVFTDGRDW